LKLGFLAFCFVSHWNAVALLLLIAVSCGTTTLHSCPSSGAGKLVMAGGALRGMFSLLYFQESMG